MTPLEPASTHVWLPEDRSVAVEIPLPILDQIRSSAVAGVSSFRHGGLEIGGVFYGVRGEKSARITAYAEFASEHALGPTFRLSETDLKAFAALIEAPHDLETIGCYRSHTRTTSVTLDDSDRQLFDHFFPSPGQVALILRPSAWGDTTAAFFVRSESGAIQDDPARVFIVEPMRRTHRVTAEQSEVRPDEPEEMNETNLVPEPTAPVQIRSRFRYRWLLPLAASIFTLILFWNWFSPHPLALEAEEFSPGEVRIHWTYLPAPFPNSATGSLEIRDGDMDVKVPLDSERLRLNSVIYPHRSKNLQIRLRVDLGTPHDGPLERAIGFVAPAVVHDAAASKPEPPVQPQIATRSADRQADDSLPVSVPALPRPNFNAETFKDQPSLSRPLTKLSKARSGQAKRKASPQVTTEPAQPIVRLPEPKSEPPRPVEAAEPVRSANALNAPEESAPANEARPSELPSTLQEAVPENPKNTGNRFVKALGRLNPLRKWIKRDAAKTKLKPDQSQ